MQLENYNHYLHVHLYVYLNFTEFLVHLITNLFYTDVIEFSSTNVHTLFLTYFITTELVEKGRINVNGKYVSNLRFADDVLIFAKMKNKLKNMLWELHQFSLATSLEISIQKTKILTNVEYKEPIKIRGKTI